MHSEKISSILIGSTLEGKLMIICVQEIHDDPDMCRVYFADTNRSLSVYSNLILQAVKNTNKSIQINTNMYDIMITGLREALTPCLVQDTIKLIVD